MASFGPQYQKIKIWQRVEGKVDYEQVEVRNEPFNLSDNYDWTGTEFSERPTGTQEGGVITFSVSRFFGTAVRGLKDHSRGLFDCLRGKEELFFQYFADDTELPSDPYHYRLKNLICGLSSELLSAEIGDIVGELEPRFSSVKHNLEWSQCDHCKNSTPDSECAFDLTRVEDCKSQFIDLEMHKLVRNMINPQKKQSKPDKKQSKADESQRKMYEDSIFLGVKRSEFDSRFAGKIAQAKEMATLIKDARIGEFGIRIRSLFASKDTQVDIAKMSLQERLNASTASTAVDAVDYSQPEHERKATAGTKVELYSSLESVSGGGGLNVGTTDDRDVEAASALLAEASIEPEKKFSSKSSLLGVRGEFAAGPWVQSYSQRYVGDIIVVGSLRFNEGQTDRRDQKIESAFKQEFDWCILEKKDIVNSEVVCILKDVFEAKNAGGSLASLLSEDAPKLGNIIDLMSFKETKWSAKGNKTVYRILPDGINTAGLHYATYSQVPESISASNLVNKDFFFSKALTRGIKHGSVCGCMLDPQTRKVKVPNLSLSKEEDIPKVKKYLESFEMIVDDKKVSGITMGSMGYEVGGRG